MATISAAPDKGAIIREVIEASSIGDADRVVRWMGDDVVYHLTGSHPFSRRTQGAETMRDLVTEVREHFADDSLRYHIDRIIVCGMTVVSTFKGTGRLTNGNVYDNDYCMIWDFEGDKVVHITDFFDSYHVHQSMLAGQ
jgi:ketosteroid isomerase-like protein